LITRRLRKRDTLLLVLLFLCLNTTVAWSSEGIKNPQKFNRDIVQGIELLYNWEFERAENIFYKAVAEKPKDPAGYFYLAMVIWAKLAAGHWTPQMVKEYGERIDRTIDIAYGNIRNEEADSFTYFYLGGALGFKGRFKLMERRYLSSFFLALEAIEALKTCQKMDPENRDVLFGLGIFDYYTARLSGVLKFLSYLLIHKGDKKEGLRKLHVASDEALYSSIEAKSLLVHIYLFLEKDHHPALPLIQEQTARFENSPRDKYLEGATYLLTGREPEFREVVNYLYQREKSASSEKMASIWGKFAVYLEASGHLLNNQPEMAREKLEAILSQKDEENDPFMIAWPLLKIGMSHDIANEREQSLAYYQRVKDMVNGGGAQYLAEKYSDTAAKEGDPFLVY
jgi:hypothetical protein